MLEWSAAAATTEAVIQGVSVMGGELNLVEKNFQVLRRLSRTRAGSAGDRPALESKHRSFELNGSALPWA
jgi:hypothetical protein